MYGGFPTTSVVAAEGEYVYRLYVVVDVFGAIGVRVLLAGEVPALSCIPAAPRTVKQGVTYCYVERKITLRRIVASFRRPA